MHEIGVARILWQEGVVAVGERSPEQSEPDVLTQVELLDER